MSLFTQIIGETLVVIPAYNAEKTINKVIDETLKTGFINILVSDDCSANNLYDLTQYNSSEVKLIKQPKNLGYGGNQKFLLRNKL